MSSNKASIKKSEFELSQKLQMHFPWGAFTDEQIKACNDAPKDVVHALVFEMVHTLSKTQKKQEVNPTIHFHIIDTCAMPLIPIGLKEVVEHNKKMGQLIWNILKPSLYLSKKQQGGSIEGNKLRRELEGKPVMNANVLDYLLAHTELIPEEWKGKAVYFWGTIYRRDQEDGDLCVRCLIWDDDRCRWYPDYYWLGHGWVGFEPALLCEDYLDITFLRFFSSRSRC